PSVPRSSVPTSREQKRTKATKRHRPLTYGTGQTTGAPSGLSRSNSMMRARPPQRLRSAAALDADDGRQFQEFLPVIATVLLRACGGDHRRVPLHRGKASLAENFFVCGARVE